MGEFGGDGRGAPSSEAYTVSKFFGVNHLSARDSVNCWQRIFQKAIAAPLSAAT